MEGVDEIIFDGFENMTERPQGYEDREVKYSGKKGTHTDIALLMPDKQTWVYYVSGFYDGGNVDFGLFKKGFPPGKGWSKKKKVIVGPGFQGIKKLYGAREIIIGEKKPEGGPKPKLAPEQKKRNTEAGRERIYVEHAIGRLKKFRVLKNRCRLKCQNFKNQVIGICAGLWNYELTLTN